MATQDIEQRKVTVKLPEQATTAQGAAANVASVLQPSVNEPTLPQGTTVSPELQNVRAGETVSTPGVTGTVTPNHELGGSTTVIVNVDASGSNVQGDDQNAREFGDQLAAAVQAVIINEKRVGGLLS